MKILWFDVETTGLDAKVNDLITISMRVEIDGEIKDKLDLKIQPYNYEAITDEALKVNKITREELKTFMEPKEAHKLIVAFFSKYVDKFKKNKTSADKFIPAGYNVLFDIQFLSEFFKKSNDNYFGAFVDYHKLDIASIVLFAKLHGIIKCEGFKLVEVAKALDVTMDNAHDAGCDIEATRIISQKLIGLMMNDAEPEDDFNVTPKVD